MSRRMAIAAVLVLALGAIAYRALPDNGFVDYDDGAHVLHDPSVVAPSASAAIREAFSLRRGRRVGWGSGWQPLTALSLAVDKTAFGLHPAAFHLENLLWHWTSALLLLALLARITGQVGRAAAVSALFVVHPIAVESVAWAVERRTVLAACFGFAAMLAWCAWVERRGTARYVLVLALTAASMMSKALLATLPLLLLALDLWPLQRPEPLRRLVIEKVPVALVCATVAAIVMLTIPRVTEGTRSVPLRLENALLIPWRQLLHLVAPLDLTAYYPFPRQIPAWQWLAAAAALALATSAAWRVRGRAPYLFAGWIWFLAALLPTSGVLQAGAWAALADRHAYVAAVGVYFGVVWAAADTFGRKAALALVPVAAALVFLTARQVSYWHDTLSLFERAAEFARDDGHVEYNLGTALIQAGRLADAERALLAALSTEDRLSSEHNQLGTVYEMTGRIELARAEYERAASLDPDDAPSVYNLARLEAAAGHGERAAQLVRHVLDILPADAAVFREDAANLLRMTDGANSAPRPRK